MCLSKWDLELLYVQSWCFSSYQVIESSKIELYFEDVMSENLPHRQREQVWELKTLGGPN